MEFSASTFHSDLNIIFTTSREVLCYVKLSDIGV